MRGSVGGEGGLELTRALIGQLLLLNVTTIEQVRAVSVGARGAVRPSSQFVCEPALTRSPINFSVLMWWWTPKRERADPKPGAQVARARAGTPEPVLAWELAEKHGVHALSTNGALVAGRAGDRYRG